MREILFRGKRTDSNKWLYGSLTNTYTAYNFEQHCFIVDGDYDDHEETEVIPETVGQYTGLTDINGTRIFEGDIVRCRHKIPNIDLYPDKKDIRPRRSYGHEIGYENDVYGTGAYLEYWRNYEVKFNFCNGGYLLNNGSDRHKLYDNYIHYHEIEVIGNIHDRIEVTKIVKGE